MGVLEIPRKMVHNYLRLVGLLLIIVYELCRRGWQNVKPALSPLLSVYDTIDTDTLTFVTATQTFVRALLMVGILYWKMVVAVWQGVTSPFRQHIEGLLAEVRASQKMAE